MCWGGGRKSQATPAPRNVLILRLELRFPLLWQSVLALSALDAPFLASISLSTGWGVLGVLDRQGRQTQG